MDYSIKHFDFTEADEIRKILTFETENITDTTDSSLDGQVFVITGSLKTYKNRAALQKDIEARGGKVASSITSKTSYLINNDTESLSNKNQKAKQLGVPIISEEEFISNFLR
jgi:DNA ligase (NAD+)